MQLNSKNIVEISLIQEKKKAKSDTRLHLPRKKHAISLISFAVNKLSLHAKIFKSVVKFGQLFRFLSLGEFDDSEEVFLKAFFKILAIV